MFVRSHPRGFATVAVMLAVTAAEAGGDGWESNPPRTPQQRPANGFEDRGLCVRNCLPRCVQVRLFKSRFRARTRSSAEVHEVGCQLDCQWPARPRELG